MTLTEQNGGTQVEGQFTATYLATQQVNPIAFI